LNVKWRITGILLSLASMGAAPATKPTTLPASFLGTWQEMREELTVLRAEVQRLRTENEKLKAKLQINPNPEPADFIAAAREKFSSEVQAGNIPTLFLRFSVGTVGRLHPGDNLRVIQIFDRSTMLVSYQRTRFLVKFIPTDGLADDQQIDPADVFLISGTDHVGSSTVFILRPLHLEQELAKAVAGRDAETEKVLRK